MNTELSSSKIYKVINYIFWGYIMLAALSLVDDMFAIIKINFAGNAAYRFFLIFIGIATLVLTVLFLIFYTIWIFKFHKNMQTIDSWYDVSPGGAIARFWIPIYNLYGLWNIHSTYSNQLKKQKDQLKEQGELFSRLYPVLYILYYISRGLGKFILKNSFRQYVDEKTEITISIIASVVDIILFLVWLKVVKIMNDTLVEQARQAAQEEIELNNQ